MGERDCNDALCTVDGCPGCAAYQVYCDELEAVAEAARSLSRAMTDAWGSPVHETDRAEIREKTDVDVETWDAPADEVKALRAALRALDERGGSDV